MCRRDGVVASGNDIIVSIPRQSVSRETEAARPMAFVKSRNIQRETKRNYEVEDASKYAVGAETPYPFIYRLRQRRAAVWVAEAKCAELSRRAERLELSI